MDKWVRKMDEQMMDEEKKRMITNGVEQEDG
jgi:hypothetical protein